MTSPESITIREWERIHLPGRWLISEAARATAAKLTADGFLEIRELRTGLELAARSHIGDIDLDDLRVRIIPKLEPDALRSLLAFSHGAGAIGPGDPGKEGGPANLLIARLISEIEGLLARGLETTYHPRQEALSSPRGRPDLQKFTARGGAITATIPCKFTVRKPNIPLNQVLLSALENARTIAPSLAEQTAPLRANLARRIETKPLSESLLRSAKCQIHSNTRAYLPALELIEALMQGQISQGGSLPVGFLFDMNRFFQTLIARLLRGYLRGLDVREEWAMQEVLRYAPDANPRQRRQPIPRPDFAIFSGDRLQTILDAKYRDLWSEPLPREMLYQLAIYAIGHGHQSTIVYPSDDPYAREARIELREPGGSWGLRTIRLRALSLTELAHLSRTPTAEARRRLHTIATALVRE